MERRNSVQKSCQENRERDGFFNLLHSKNVSWVGVMTSQSAYLCHDPTDIVRSDMGIQIIILSVNAWLHCTQLSQPTQVAQRKGKRHARLQRWVVFPAQGIDTGKRAKHQGQWD